MIRGTDTQFIFNLPYQCSDVDFVKIIFWQPENNGPSVDRPLPITKLLAQCYATGSPNQLCVVLDREETLRFSDKRKAYVQLRGTTKDGVTFGNRKHMITVYPTIDVSFLDETILPSPTYSDYVVLDGEEIYIASDESDELDKLLDAGKIK
jgi:hypothetical protein